MIDWFIELNNIHFTAYAISLLFIILLLNYFYLTNSSIVKRTLFFIRFFSIIIVILILFNPIINFKNEYFSQSKLNLFIDNSKSISLAFNNKENNIIDVINSFEEWSDKKNVTLNTFFFSDTVSSLKLSEVDLYNGTKTNFSNLFEYLNSFIGTDEQSIIISDGINNHGLINYNKKLLTTTHVLGVGQELTSYDLGITSVEYVKEKNDILLNITFEAKNVKDQLTKQIYLTNEKFDKFSIGSIDLSDNNFKNIDLKISDKFFSEFNVISLDYDQFDYNNINNSYLINIDNENFKKDNILFLSGVLSPNTKIIKKILNESFSNIDINHYYKINNIWNEEPLIDDMNSISAVVLDNIYINDLDDNLLSFIDKYKKIFFINNNTDFNQINFLKDCAKLNINKNVFESVNIKKYIIDIPPINQMYSFDCDNYYNENSYFFRNENNLVVNIDNLYKTNYLSSNYNLKNNLIEYVGFLIEDIIFNRSNKLNIFSEYNSVSLNDSLKILYNFNSSFINSSNIFLVIKDVKNNVINLIENNLINNNLAEFVFVPKNEGYYEIIGMSDNGSKLDYSNKININVLSKDIEISSIYLNKKHLSDIALINKGYYFHINDYEEFFSNLYFEKNKSENVIRKDFLSYQYLLIILIFLLILEWYIRNKIGLP
tara:strand:- start:285 stop:2255 length:1971 start_codon:yes stop_codon:yes gene_type:complete